MLLNTASALKSRTMLSLFQFHQRELWAITLRFKPINQFMVKSVSQLTVGIIHKKTSHLNILCLYFPALGCPRDQLFGFGVTSDMMLKAGGATTSLALILLLPLLCWCHLCQSLREYFNDFECHVKLSQRNRIDSK